MRAYYRTVGRQLDADLTTEPMSFDHRKVLSRNVMKRLLAGGLPLVVYVYTASGYAHWLDTGEFVAAAADFGISHPPGHPLASLVLGLANLLPIGALSFRVALVCALLGAVAAVALFSALERTFRVSGVIREPLIVPLSLAGTWWVAGSQAWWFQAVRPEVYALQAALLCIAIERLLCVATSGRDGDVRPLYHAALAIGLALANHHYLVLLALVPAMWLLIGVWTVWGWRPFAWSTGFLGAGLLTYLFLPLRAISEPFLNLGDPTTPSRFVWVVSAQAFQKSLGPERIAPFREHLTDVIVAMGQDLHLGTLLLALLGAYFMLRVRAARKFGLFWLTVWLVYMMGRALLGFVHGNPDALAYFMMAYASVGVFAGFALGVVLSAVAEAAPGRPRLVPALGAIVALASLFQFARSYEEASLANFVDTDVFDDGLRRSLPARAVVLAHNPNTIFRFWGGEAEELNRPDVTMVPLPMSSYPKLVDRLVSDEPELKLLLRNYVLDGQLNAADLQSLAALRPVFIEMDIRVATEMFDMLVPEQLYHRVLTADITETDEGQAMQRHGKLWDDIDARIGEPHDAQTEVQLLWRHYNDALYFAGVGDLHGARRSVGAGLSLNPHAAELLLMQDALKHAPSGEPIDIAPFRVQ